ncbi:MAG: germination protein YpeB [Oscillospiraceae bacterium]|jgi:germination protein YpeB|nr:germination protein YpeB [Oscillospiraceae bacterium]
MQHLHLPSHGTRRAQARVLLVSFTLAALAVMGGFIYTAHLANENYKRAVVNNYRSAFNYAAGSIGELDAALDKSAVSGTSGMATVNMLEVYGAAMSAKQALGELPHSDRDFEKASGFISTVGDYALALTKKTARGTALTDEETKNLRKLADSAAVLSGNLTELISEINDGRLTLKELDELSKKAGDEAENLSAYGETMKTAEREFPEMPTLIYDGPFSTHIAGMKPQFLEGKTEVTRDDAKKAAEKFTGLSGITDDGERGGNLASYLFTASADGATVSIEVTKQGGVVYNVYASHMAREGTIAAKDGIKTAEKHLAEHGFADMKMSYYQVSNGVVTVNFAHTQGDVIVYPDLIKIEVALDSGKVIGFEAQGYVMHHRDREIPEPKIDETAAQAKVSKSLTVKSHKLAIIPTSGKNEVLCHEFICENAEQKHYIVYVNAETGDEQQILVLIESENGTLTL